MRAHSITTMIAVGVCALAIPASVSARSTPPPANPSPDVNSGYAAYTTGIGSSASEPTSQGGSGGSPDVNSGYAAYTTGIGSSASEPTVISGSPAKTANGFDWGSAAVGAGAVMALVALGGAGLLTVRRRTAVSSASTS